ncbi:MAG TPA: CDP-alcohol phosphatidyltransferase family protein [Candidatus Latescibacteria bacterium]|nr:CDP-alcohol phosphatidyltransferase family protein [Candidatus Latescibacterota bacterium]
MRSVGSFLSRLGEGEVVFSSKLKDGFARFIAPLTRLLVKSGLHPDILTVIGLALNIGVAISFSLGWFPWAGIMCLVAGLFDFLDGQVARASHRGTKFGALLDSTLDRYSEAFIFLGIAIYLLRTSWVVTKIVLLFALAGSLMVSYVRARAEGLGVECQVGLMQRTERTIMIALGAIFGRAGLIVVIWGIAILANYTVVERMWHLWKKMNRVGLEGPSGVSMPEKGSGNGK